MEEQKSKYEEIVNWVQARLDCGELDQGDRLESENELTAIFGVSRQTVRHAISVLDNRGMVDRRRGSGTYIKIPEKQERKITKTKRIGIVTTYVNEYIFLPIIQEMERVLSKSGYNMQVSFTNNSIEKERLILKSLLKDMAVDGIITEPARSGLPNPNLPLYRAIMDLGVPVIFLNSFYKELPAPYVGLDDKAAGKIAAEHLLQCGHRKIGGIFKADDGQGHERYAGYVEALMEAEVKVKGERIAWIDTEGLRSPVEDFHWVLKRLTDCTACVCYNDEVAKKLINICLEQGISIPEDLSVVGIDNSDLGIFCEVPFTSVENPVNDLGRTAALKMMELLNGHAVEHSMTLKPKVIMRNSVRMIDNMLNGGSEV